MKRIAVFTSGGDSPGMNACIRAVVHAGAAKSIEVYGIYRGYDGMINGEIKELFPEDVSNIVQRGGTILKSARSEYFRKEEGRKLAAEKLKELNIEGVVAIGGDGTFAGARLFYEEHGIPSIGVPGTIDNDLYGTDYTLGYDTALNTIVEAVDKIRDTATSHDRLFFVEVMGRDAGFLALRSGIAVGADAILIPETRTHIDRLVDLIRDKWQKRRSAAIIIVAEGDDEGGAYEIARKVKAQFSQYDTRITVLGHIQRGGNPTAMDRVLGASLGQAAVEALLEGRKNEMVGLMNKKIHFTPFEKAIKHHGHIHPQLMELAEKLLL